MRLLLSSSHSLTHSYLHLGVAHVPEKGIASLPAMIRSQATRGISLVTRVTSLVMTTVRSLVVRVRLRSVRSLVTRVRMKPILQGSL